MIYYYIRICLSKLFKKKKMKNNNNNNNNLPFLSVEQLLLKITIFYTASWCFKKKDDLFSSSD